MDLNIPPTSLGFEQWMNLFDIFKKVGGLQAERIISGSEKRLRKQQQKLQKVHRTRVR